MQDLLIIFLIVVIIGFLFFIGLQLIYVLSWFFTSPPSVPTDKRTRGIMLNYIKKYRKTFPENLTIFDLGSGWGHLAIDCARKFPESTVYGLELFFPPYFVSKCKTLYLRYSNLHFKRKDIFTQDLTDANVVVCFLFPSLLAKLKDKFKQELKPGSIIISNNFEIAGWTPVHMTERKDLFTNRKIYLYKIPD